MEPEDSSLTSGFVENKNPYGSSSTQYSACMQMVGREIFDFATRDVVQSIHAISEHESVDYYLLHQANSRILDKVARKLKVPRHKFCKNMQFYGNTSAASIPILLDEEVKRGTLSLGSGPKVVFLRFRRRISIGDHAGSFIACSQSILKKTHWRNIHMVFEKFKKS